MRKRTKITLIVLLVMLSGIMIFFFQSSFSVFVFQREKKGTFTIISGDLSYEIASADLIDQKIIVAANSKKKVNLVLKSLNPTESNYQLFFSHQEGIQIKYLADHALPFGVIGKENDTKEITLVITNESSKEQTVQINCKGGITLPLSFASNEQKIEKEYLLTINVTQSVGGTITIVNDTKNTSSTSTLEASYQDKIRVIGTPASEYQLKSLSFNGTAISSGQSFSVGLDHITVTGVFIYQDGWHGNIYYNCGLRQKQRFAHYSGSYNGVTTAVPAIAGGIVDPNGIWQYGNGGFEPSSLYLAASNTSYLGMGVYWVVLDASLYSKAEIGVREFNGRSGDYITFAFVTDGSVTTPGTSTGIANKTVLASNGSNGDYRTLTVDITGDKGLVLISAYSSSKHGNYQLQIIEADLYYKDYNCS